jgi:hypothetical protein
MSVAKTRDRQSPAHESARDMSTSIREAPFTTPWARLDTAVASSQGFHAINEDWYSAPTDLPLFVVADGMSSGAMASSASQVLVLRLHQALERGASTPRPRSAVLIADRE